MSTATDARLSSLDRMLDDSQVSDSFATGMFAVDDALESSATLRRAVTDPGTPEGARRALVHGLLDGKVGQSWIWSQRPRRSAGREVGRSPLHWNGRPYVLS
jgi:hypothetical protein